MGAGRRVAVVHGKRALRVMGGKQARTFSTIRVGKWTTVARARHGCPNGCAFPALAIHRAASASGLKREPVCPSVCPKPSCRAILGTLVPCCPVRDLVAATGKI